MKKIILLGLFVLFAASVLGASCTLRTSCLASETEIFSVSNTTNAMSAEAGTYPFKVCCPGSYNISCGNTFADTYFRFSNLTSAHVQTTDYTSYDYPGKPPSFSNNLCINASTFYNYGPSDCPSGSFCLVRMYSETNAHVSNCNNLSYPIKVCIAERTGCNLVSVGLNDAYCSGMCDVNDDIEFKVLAFGPDCYKADTLVVEGSSENATCRINMWNGHIIGMNASVSGTVWPSFPGSFFYFNWSVPYVNDECSGKQVFSRKAYLFNMSSGLPVSTSLNVSGNFTLSDYRIPMKCGNVSIRGITGFNKSCTEPVPNTGKVCSSEQCLWDTGGPTYSCANPGSNRTDMGREITCSYNNTWCPRYFFYNTSSHYCEFNLTICDEGYYPNVASPVPAFNLTCYSITEMLENPFKCLLGDFGPPPAYNVSCCNVMNWDGYHFCKYAEVVIY